MPCEKCGGTLYWLMMIRMPKRKDVETDYLMCENCEAIYRQVISTKIELKEVKPTELKEASG